jgi:drug/metabolite transporter (DMT)-like permease
MREFSRTSLIVVTAAGVLGTGLGSILFIYAVEDLGAARTAFLTTSAPLFALPMGVLFLSDSVTRRVLAGTLATIGGIWLVLL